MLEIDLRPAKLARLLRAAPRVPKEYGDFAKTCAGGRLYLTGTPGRTEYRQKFRPSHVSTRIAGAVTQRVKAVERVGGVIADLAARQIGAVEIAGEVADVVAVRRLEGVGAGGAVVLRLDEAPHRG